MPKALSDIEPPAANGNPQDVQKRLTSAEKHLHALCDVNSLPQSSREEIYRRLLPASELQRFGIDADAPFGAENPLVELEAPEGSGIATIKVWPAPGSTDPLIQIEVLDNCLSQLELLLLVINDPDSERFGTDRDWQGERTMFGTVRRNIPEETRAMKAGLAPGQVRRGLRLSRVLFQAFEEFARGLGRDFYVVEPLAYHNAILFERLGFNYIRGLERMRWIHQEFQPGGSLHEALDGSTPFRQPDAWLTARGRSWAIHDGVLGEPWHGINMVKFVGKKAGVETFPDGIY
ncbi:hypothetical protein ACFLT5_00675 [Chloroflexota bacterium]